MHPPAPVPRPLLTFEPLTLPGNATAPVPSQQLGSRFPTRLNLTAANEETAAVAQEKTSASPFSSPRYQQIELKMTQLREEEIYVIGTKCSILLMQLNTVKLYNDSSPLDKGASVCAGLARSFHHLRSCN